MLDYCRAPGPGPCPGWWLTDHGQWSFLVLSAWLLFSLKNNRINIFYVNKDQNANVSLSLYLFGFIGQEILCLYNTALCLKALTQKGHWYFLTSECINSCDLTKFLEVKLAPHMEQS